MNRKEEIKKASKNVRWISESLNLQSAFIEGAKWADKTMLDKACEWLKTLTYQEFAGAPLERLITDELIAEFKQAMEGGAE